MAKSQVGVTSPNDNQERLDRPTGGENPRERLLAGVPMTERRLRLAGLLTAVLEGGDGPPVVLLHGPGEFAAKWLRVIPDLAQTNRVIAPDLPGHGESEPFDGPPEIDRVVAWLDDLIESTCGMPPVLVGQTIGGAMAAHFAIHRGDRVSGLVLVDTLGLQPFQPAPEFGLALMSFVSEPTEDTHDRLWSQCAFNLDELRHAMGARWEDFKAYNLDRAHAPELRPAQHALMESYGMPAIRAADLTRIAVPTTLIWGRHDLATPVSVAEATRERYGWPLRVIENAADDPPLEQPEAFLQALRAALRESARVAQRGAAQRSVKEKT
jgi:pimeloyl-ACP methyl ester carboxylesterase